MDILKRLLLTLTLLFGGLVCSAARPNIVWILVDDMSSHFGYQGGSLVNTPHVDRLAREGVSFTKAYATAPVCSTFRTSMITGMYQTSIGGHHHRSSRGVEKIHLPKGMKTIPEYFRDAGYYTSNGGASGGTWGKEDYNFVFSRDDLYQGRDWSGRAEGQPFFAQFQTRGGKWRNIEKWYKELEGDSPELITADQVTLPPYYPEHPVIREDWAQYLNSVNYTDIEVGRILDRLKADGLLENTIVFFLTDHGISHARGKQFLYEEGLLIPFVVWGPGLLPEAGIRDELIAHIDIGATSLQLAGIEIPDTMQGRPLFGANASPRDYVVSARDRCDETVDRIRSIRKGDFKYIRNFHPQRPYLQPSLYKDSKPFMPVLRELYAAGELNAVQSLQMAETRPEEELYDLSADPWEIRNLAADSVYRVRLLEFRALLEQWVEDSDDQGRFPEPESMYDSDMEGPLKKIRKQSPENAAILKSNIALMKRWQAEGK